MTHSTQSEITDNGKGDAEPVTLDSEAIREYLPMNIAVDPRTMRIHFQGSSIGTRSVGNHPRA
jgi:hypothetical protein